tara:strand:- start:19 stop:354 length:336 start_codon:yes stop_codon:yes gene_type:complete
MNNASDYNLDAMATSWAVEIFEQVNDIDEAHELASQYADGSEWVIYHHKSHELCLNCNTDNGEMYLEDCGIPDGATYNSIGSMIAYFEIETRLNAAIQTLFDMADEIEAAA